ncbi:hypothetical protein MmiAt1_12480 [Methanimicrococcus sp. At1]|uniref:Uncharacterized protein n=1 Tax=Methanimicrococcus hacksteinii TaxID=3028293 RepID=A0ABU3VR70_9EURY|nr:hypothetical protein [Methanimicrococcus sp. At1]MDV0445656.1 hypothetical protein [Methanimicrococcus sp. At1]
MHHLIFITSARYASVGTDYLTVSVWHRLPTVSVWHRLPADFVNTVADLPAYLLPLPSLLSAALPLHRRRPRASRINSKK